MSSPYGPPPFPPASPGPSGPSGPRTRARGWGIASALAAVVGVVPVLLVFLLAVTVDENFGWLLIPAFAWVVLTGAAGVLLGVVGLVLACVDRRCFTWPVVGLVASLALLAPVLAVV